MGTGALTLGVKWPECEDDHSFPSKAKVQLYFNSNIHIYSRVFN
jgi:hypothetical protein